jgi:hypothetical protein
MADEIAQCDSSFDSPESGDGPEMMFEIRIADDAEAQRLCLAQAQVLREVIEWAAARKHCEPGQDLAA